MFSFCYQYNMRSSKPISERYLTAGYVAALGIVALLTVASHFTLDRVLAAHEGSAEIVNVSGRQRMLSQRIAGLAAQYRLGSATAKADLLSAVGQFESAHHKLLAESTGDDRPGHSTTFRDIYFSGDAPLDGEVTSFIDLARRIVASRPDAADTAPALEQLFREARAPLLHRLDDVVVHHQQDSERQLAHLETLQRLTLTVVLGTLAIEALLIFRPMVRKVATYTSELLRLATVDGLTGTLNRVTFLEQGGAAVARAQRRGQAVAVLMMDADHFKAINDTFGHAGGDAALRALGQAITGFARAKDLTGRLGGEEFAMLLPDAGEAEAAALAHRLRATVEALAVAHGGRTMRLTISIGVAAWSGAPVLPDLPALLRNADRALYAAKAIGRNRVVIDGAAPATPVLAWSQEGGPAIARPA